jgi:hypothetical protein
MNKAIGFKGSEVSMLRILNSTGFAMTAEVSMTLQYTRTRVHACTCTNINTLDIDNCPGVTKSVEEPEIGIGKHKVIEVAYSWVEKNAKFPQVQDTLLE